ncbi:NCS2 family permease [Piscirickettsia salmonis]|uniref:Permease YicO n=2 Tax=Piscirickettsia salmonis TaxID=1238 RepID=A0A9Q5VGB9_PISSA|nr:NCS2 family permease [Piscirickettsia salmonis]ALA25126.1 permease family protein [Piscirickettsia salmonis]ERL63012.1 permease family protein [Piscirickettsia salmonis LF-89 = ATCC VR-1361]PEQ15870.1 NCS2 family permease [Piscirickettsia salmonis]QGN77007.1 Putative permease YicO [Piscirickettsia salmonis]QGN80597.1 Putative permease YicO [Piscirickettsia salmonis]
MFQLKHYQTTARTEVIAGITTFLTMAYIVIVNPSILATTQMDKGAVFVATCLAAGMATLAMGLWANFPVAVAPGMGMNAYFAFVLVGAQGYSWESMLAAVFVSGVLFYILTVLRLRHWLVGAIPEPLVFAITGGIGLFIGVLGLKISGVVVSSPTTLVTLGSLHKPEVLLSVFGFLMIVILDYYRVKGGILISIISVSILGAVFGISSFHGVLSMPPSLAPTWLRLDIHALLHVSMISAIVTFFILVLFDNTGTMLGLLEQANLHHEIKGQRLTRAFYIESAGTALGALLGTTSLSAYVESAAGIGAGGRTGLTSVVVAGLFFIILFFAPLATAIPSYATAPVLVYVAILIFRCIVKIDWQQIRIAVPCFITVIMIPLSFSIADGIGLGILSYLIIYTLTGKIKEIPCGLWLIGVLFIGLFFLAH